VAGRLIPRLLRRGREEGRAEPTSVPFERELEVISDEDRWIIERALPFTMTGIPRLQALVDAVRYCVRREIPGDFVECGVWRGGSVLAILLTLIDEGVTDRDVWLFDTFEGMTEPTEKDTSDFHDAPASEYWRQAEGKPWPEWFGPDVFSEEIVRENVASAGYPEVRLRFVKGPVEETIPGSAPAEIALLRLDTDWYESTRHELEHLYPRLATGGVLILDDYGHWKGARQAVDEYFAADARPLLLVRVDYAGRVAVKA
jgi:O-methyltransferase